MRSKKPYKKLACLLLGIIYVFIFSSASLLISPVKFQVVVVPGGTYNGLIKVKNVFNQRLAIKVTFSSLFLDPMGNPVDNSNDDSVFSNNVTSDPVIFSLGPQEDRIYRFQFRMPPGMDEEVSGKIVFSPFPEEGEPAFEGIFKPGPVLIPFFASPPDVTEKNAEISGFYVKQYDQQDSVACTLVFRNKGLLHIRPQGILRLFDEDKNQLFSCPLNPGRAPILKSSFGIVKKTLGTGLQAGNFVVRAEIEGTGDMDMGIEKSLYIFPKKRIKNFQVKVVYPSGQKDSRKVTSPISMQAASSLKAIEMERRKKGTVISLIADGRLSFDPFELDDPYRLVLDIKGVLNDLPSKTLELYTSEVLKIRTSQFKISPEKITRVVVDFMREQKYDLVSLSDRLVVYVGIPAPATPEAEEKRESLPSVPYLEFNADLVGSVKIGEGSRGIFKVISLSGTILYQVPIQAEEGDGEMHLSGRWSRIPDPGIYFGELVLVQEERIPIVSYSIFKVE
ncbi:MAG: AMIN domain-containing protein [Candidatus Aminicenantes bacterium]|nr:AMIN domain-containing protein [Candidatus Aminicenantes bacterium]